MHGQQTRGAFGRVKGEKVARECEEIFGDLAIVDECSGKRLPFFCITKEQFIAS